MGRCALSRAAAVRRECDAAAVPARTAAGRRRAVPQAAVVPEAEAQTATASWAEVDLLVGAGDGADAQEDAGDAEEPDATPALVPRPRPARGA